MEIKGVQRWHLALSWNHLYFSIKSSFVEGDVSLGTSLETGCIVTTHQTTNRSRATLDTLWPCEHNNYLTLILQNLAEPLLFASKFALYCYGSGTNQV